MVIGIVGGGQLARMIALAGIPLGMRFIFLDPAEDACAAPLGEHLCGAYDDKALLDQLAEKADVVTYEFENVPATAIAHLTPKIDVFPSEAALATARDRMNEKSLCRQLGIPTVPFVDIDSLETLEQAVEEVGLPAILKTRTMGYDGKGQMVLRQRDELPQAWEQMGSVPLILEGFARFDREISIISVRSKEGETRFYPVSENQHKDGILDISYSRPGDPKQAEAEGYAQHILDELDYVGVMALELFDCGDQLLVNEMAPRVHNSGHWTIEGALTSQFENHVRAVAQLPLGSTAAKGYAKMVNFIGEVPDHAEVLANPDNHLHDYNKAAKPGRKVGHATLWSSESL